MMTPEQIQQFLVDNDPDTVTQHILDQYTELFQMFAPLLQEADRHMWQPIATVPSTDEENTVDFWVPGRGRIPNAYLNWERICYDKMNKGGFVSTHVIDPSVKASHWRHRPRAPEGMKEENPAWL